MLSKGKFTEKLLPAVNYRLSHRDSAGENYGWKVCMLKKPSNVLINAANNVVDN